VEFRERIHVVLLSFHAIPPKHITM
jgi:hypothetical protein